MAPYGFSVTKKMTWRGTEEFSNVYHYDCGAGVSDSTLEAFLDAIVAAEKTVHTSQVTFVSGRVWGPTGQGAQVSETRVVKDYTGTGTLIAAASAVMYREATVLVEWYIGRAPGTGRKRILKKFLHACGLPSSSSGIWGDVTIGQNNKDPFITWGNTIKTLNAGVSGADLCTEDGTHLPTGTNPTVNDYLRIRQFKQGRKRKVV